MRSRLIGLSPQKEPVPCPRPAQAARWLLRAARVRHSTGCSRLIRFVRLVIKVRKSILSDLVGGGGGVHRQLRLREQRRFVQVQNALAALNGEILILHLVDGLLLRGSIVLFRFVEPRIRFFERISLFARVVDWNLHLNGRHVVVREIRACMLPLKVHAEVGPEILQSCD